MGRNYDTNPKMSKKHDTLARCFSNHNMRLHLYKQTNFARVDLCDLCLIMINDGQYFFNCKICKKDYH